MRETRVADAKSLEPATVMWPDAVEIIDDLRHAFLSAPSDELVKRHIADMLVIHEATRFLARDERRKRRRVIGSSFGIGAAALMTGAGVAAAEGSLPGPLQDAVASVAEPFGLDVPSGDAGDTTPADDAGAGRPESVPGQAPGQQSGPGESENAPGHGGEDPGRSSTAPGHSDTANNGDTRNNRPESPPGLVDEHTTPSGQQPPGLEDGVGPPLEPGGEARRDRGFSSGRGASVMR